MKAEKYGYIPLPIICHFTKMKMKIFLQQAPRHEL